MSEGTTRYTQEVIEFEARLQNHIDRQVAKWEAADERKGRPPSKKERDDLWHCHAMIEET
jgi:hypothetical protein